MNAARRRFLVLGGGGLAALRFGRAGASTSQTGETLIEMRGSPRGEHVGFMPLGLALAAGTRVVFVNRDPGNSHTATAYHPDILDRQRRIPSAAAPFDSGLLLPDERFAVTLTAPGVYDLYCQPHEHAGMVARLVVGRPGDPGWEDEAPPSDDLPEAALAAFPAVAAILSQGRVTGEGFS